MNQVSGKKFTYSSDQLTRCIDPLTQTLLKLHRRDQTAIVGIQGGQGTGKTTLAGYLADTLSEKGYRVASFSIDDFYTSHEHRMRLSAEYPGNPFYQLPRGMPGTHRTAALHRALSCFKNGDSVELPIFDKSLHLGYGDIKDLVVAARGRKDFVIFEGWCIGMPQVAAHELLEICRRRKLSDAWQPDHLDVVLGRLGPYQPVWDLVDTLVMLHPDSIHLHEHWRLKQEQELIARTGSGMVAAEVSAMVRHFLPFTCLCYEKIVPDIRVRINAEHRYYEMIAS
jgi:D-glycerate 3-kinase